jgi:hypothetical protein
MEKDYIEKHRRGWENNIKVCCKDTDREPVNWIEVGQDRVLWSTFVVAVV